MMSCGISINLGLPQAGVAQRGTALQEWVLDSELMLADIDDQMIKLQVIRSTKFTGLPALKCFEEAEIF